MLSEAFWGLKFESVMHLSTACPTIPLPHETTGYKGDFTGEAGPRVGHTVDRCIIPV